MSKIKYLTLLLALTFVLAIPVSAAQIRVQNAKAEEASTTVSTDATEKTSDYVKARIQELKDAKDTAKAELSATLMANIQTRVEAMIQNAVRRYERVQTQIQNAEGLTDAEKAELQTKVTAQIEAMNTLRTQVQAATTTTELKNVMTQVKTRFKLSLGLMRQAVSGVFEDRLNTALTKLTDVYTRLDEKVTALPDGDEKTELSALLAEAQSLLSEAKVNIDGGELETAKENLMDARDNLHEVAEALQN